MVELPASRDQVEVKVHRPKTDLNFKRDIRVHPSWIRRDEIVLGLGELNITYLAQHPISELSTSCTTRIFVIGERGDTMTLLRQIN